MAKKKDPQQTTDTDQSGNGHKKAAEAVVTQPIIPKEIDYTETPEFQSALAEAAERIKQEVEEQYSNKGKAALKLVNMAFDTPEAKLAELTIIPRGLIMWLVYQICLEAYSSPLRDPIKTPISKVQRTAFFQLMRSVEGQHLIRAAALAQEQLRITEEEAGVPEKW